LLERYVAVPLDTELRFRSPTPRDRAQGGKLTVKVTERAWTSPIWYLP